MRGNKIGYQIIAFKIDGWYPELTCNQWCNDMCLENQGHKNSPAIQSVNMPQ